jgi:hypothetical protein
MQRLRSHCAEPQPSAQCHVMRLGDKQYEKLIADGRGVVQASVAEAEARRLCRSSSLLGQIGKENSSASC